MKLLVSYILTSLFCLATPPFLPYETIVLKDHTVINGYISRQEIGRSPEIKTLCDGKYISRQVPFSDIDYIETASCPDYPIIDEIVSRSGTAFQGVVTKQIVGKGLYIKDKNQNLQYVLYSDMLFRRIVSPASDQSILSSSLFWDALKTKEGKEYKGVIIEQHYGNNISEVFYIIATEEGTQQVVNYSDIICKSRFPNPSLETMVMDAEIVSESEEINAPSESVPNADDVAVNNDTRITTGEQGYIIMVTPKDLSKSGLLAQISKYGANDIRINKIPKQYLLPVSIDVFSELNLPSMNFAFLNTVPVNSYKIEMRDNHPVIVVMDKFAFWGKNKFVIIQIEYNE